MIMKPTLRQIEEREKQKKEKRQIDTLIKYDRAKICPKCGELMRYAFGEVFKCDNCGAEELTSFGFQVMCLSKVIYPMNWKNSLREYQLRLFLCVLEEALILYMKKKEQSLRC